MGRFERDFERLGVTPGMRLRTLRYVAGFTQEDIGNAIGVDRSHISRLECDTRQLTLELALEYAAVLGVSTDDLLGSIVFHRTGRDVAVQRDALAGP